MFDERNIRAKIMCCRMFNSRADQLTTESGINDHPACMTDQKQLCQERHQR